MLEERFDKKLDKVVAGLDQVKETVNRKSEEVTTQFGNFRGELKSLNDRLLTLLEFAQRTEERQMSDIRELREGHADHRYRLSSLEEIVKKIPKLEEKSGEHDKAIEKFVPKDKLDDKFRSLETQNAIVNNIYTKYIQPALLIMLISGFGFIGGRIWDNISKPNSMTVNSSPTFNVPSK